MSEIQWTDVTWNPVRGCSVVSPGCTNCYAMKTAHRFSGPGKPYHGLTKQTASGPQWTGEVRFVPEKLAEPLHWRKPRRVFVNSMSDLFHEGVTDEQIAAVFGVMAACPQHTFQVLTKRPARAREWFEWAAAAGQDLLTSVGDDPSRPKPNGEIASTCACIAGEEETGGVLRPKDWRAAMKAVWPLPNVWLGVSVEDQKRADERIPELLECPAALHFLSMEPLLGPVELDPAWLSTDLLCPSCEEPRCEHESVGWVIVGGESGPGARPCDIAWIRSIVEQCKGAGVPPFIKQVGARPRIVGGEEDIDWLATVFPSPGVVASLGQPYEVALTDRKGGDPAEWPADVHVREWPAVLEPEEQPA